MSGPFKQGDILGISHKGREWFAIVESETRTTVITKPITPGVTWFEVPKRDVKTVWRFSRGPIPYIKKSCGLSYADGA